MTLYRAFPWNPAVQPEARGGALWFPRGLQGDGRHDGPERYGCLYVSEEPVSALVEELARFVGTTLAPPDLLRGKLPLALAAIELPGDARLVDLDDPLVLDAEELRPSLVATRERARTQAVAQALHDRHPDAVGLRWWSPFEPRWANVTLFDRARARLTLAGVRPLGLGDEEVGEAARHLGLKVASVST